uniref:Uncharacterized protein n=1 Tax=Cajanus cajan TaxID=3821 RepID=A0A151TIQ3_CAJCA|nr:hypothetical protein KK1_013249 [Cajanus cajan]
MNHGRENSKVQHQLQPFGEQEQYTSPYFSYPSLTSNNHTLFDKFCPSFSTMKFNSRAEVEKGNSNSFTPSEDSCGYSDVFWDHSCVKSETDSSNEEDGDASDEEVSLDELLLDEKIKKKIELLAAMVGVDATDPAIVLNEVVRVLKVLKMIY